MALNPDLTTNNYIVIPKVYDHRLAYSAYQDMIRDGQKEKFYNVEGYHCVGDTYNLYKPDQAEEILLDLMPYISEIAGEELLPTYSMARLYKNGSSLTKHVDRPSCEVSMTLHLGGDKPWELVFEKPNGLSHEVVLEPGDGVLYLGCTAVHSRKGSYTGNYYAQLFLHYVRSQGPLAYTKGDLNINEPDFDWRNQLCDEYYLKC